MKFNKLFFELIFSFIVILPFVSADLKSSPSEDVPIFVFLVVVALLLVGTFFLVLWIIRKIRGKK